MNSLEKQDDEDNAAQVIKKIIDRKKTGVVVSPVNKHDKMVLLILNKTHGNKLALISLNLNYKQLKGLEKDGISLSKTYLISYSKKENSRMLKINPGTSLTELSLIATTLAGSGDFDVLSLDSIDKLLVQNEPKTVEKFIEHLCNKLEYSGMGVMFLATEEQAKEILPEINKICEVEFIK